ncbi:MAG: hydantoinase/oxoprolinase family protein [Chloroflexi bacterium]|nr:hydantoinase/oxoprolinase family protein [Chloroflexota bacterium]
MKPYIVAVDSGGTFSDCVVIGERGRTVRGKALSTPKDPSLGVVEAAGNAAAALNMTGRELLSRASVFGHGTTISTNAILTRQGAKVGLITTKGHEDALAIGRVHQKVAGLTEDEIINVAMLEKANPPIVPRSLTIGVTERMDRNGRVVVSLDTAGVRQAAKYLLDEGVEALAVCFLWSFINPDHERAAKNIISDAFPGLPVTISSELSPVLKEYERTATTVMNAYIGQLTEKYLLKLNARLAENGFDGSLNVMSCAGGLMSVAETVQKPVFAIGSGPAGGAMGALALGEALGYKNIVTSDVGGTSFDVGLIVNGEPVLAGAPVISKYHLLVPMVDVVSIGAGGGSIAWIEKGTGMLKVGPQSAGSEPGPVCYDRGGVEPAVTDADLVLGRLDPDYFWGGRMRLNKERALAAMEEKIARPLKMGVVEAAAGIVEIVDAHMADLVRKMTIGRGYDPRNFILFSFGGAGPGHFGAYARDVGVPLAIVPEKAAVFSAYGIAISDTVYIEDLSEPMTMPSQNPRIAEIFEALEEKVVEKFKGHGAESRKISLRYFLEMRYKGQVHALYCPVEKKEILGRDTNAMVRTFDSIYEKKYGKGTAFKEAGVEATTFRVMGVVKGPELAPPPVELAGPDPSAALKGKRPVYFKESRGFVLSEVYEYDRLKTGNVVDGPAIVEAPDTTAVIHPGQQMTVDRHRNLVLKLR